MVLIRGDEDALKQVLINLITNSIRYSHEEKYLKISTLETDNKVTIQVSDKGIGINLDEQDHIFDAFYRGSDERIKNIGGAGIGLTIVSHVVLAHNGEIEISSKPEQGTSVLLTFPLIVNKV